MLTFRDFFHLPQLDEYIKLIKESAAGMIIVAGLDSRPAASQYSPAGLFLPSGRGVVADIVWQEILDSCTEGQVVVVTSEKSGYRPRRSHRRRISVLFAAGTIHSGARIREAIESHPALMLLDRLTPENVEAALEAGQSGIKILVQMDTILRGAALSRQLTALVSRPDLLGALKWVLSVQRLPALCPHCKVPALPGQAEYSRISDAYPHLEPLAGSFIFPQDGIASQLAHLPDHPPGFFRAGGCERCQFSGRQGDVAAFDIYRAGERPTSPEEQTPSVGGLALEDYALRLAAYGCIEIDDLFKLEEDQLRRTYYLLAASEQALQESNAELTRKLAELEAANKVLVQRTDVLISLQNLNQALTATDELNELAEKVCRQARQLCGGDRSVVYRFIEEPPGTETAEVLASSGWDSDRAVRRIGATELLAINSGTDPAPFARIPPGFPIPAPDDQNMEKKTALLAGMSVPLISNQQRVGLMIVQSTQTVRFNPGESALLQTLANQAALAIQRAGLLADLRAKIAQLQEAQVELVKKERLEHELDLARQVQQSMLPARFPEAEGYLFAARNLPARQVGGDFYDVFELDDDRLGLVIGDVSDKGMPAALFMALTRSLIRAEALREISPLKVLLNTNRLLFALGEPQQFVSVFYGVIERNSGRMSYCRAGHDYPCLIRNGRLVELEQSGMVLAVMEGDDLHLEESVLQFNGGDRLVLYTDGLTDALDQNGQIYGLARLESTFLEYTNLSAKDFCSAVFDDLEAYRGSAERFDDMTLLVIDVL
jgi:serine phosphatase RsbU (regulator of sigma subunit)